jgi:arsenate reductase
MHKKQNVLFLCNDNAGRSQMAEGLLRHSAEDRLESLSAGLEPDSQVHPLAIQVMNEIGIDISSQKPKAVDIYLGKTMIHDLMILCDKTQSTCPNVWPGTPFQKRYYWPINDPEAVSGTAEEKLAAFRNVRDVLKEKIASWLNEDIEPSAIS